MLLQKRYKLHRPQNAKKGTALPFEAFGVDRSSQLKTLAALVHARKIKALQQGSTSSAFSANT